MTKKKLERFDPWGALQEMSRDADQAYCLFEQYRVILDRMTETARFFRDAGDEKMGKLLERLYRKREQMNEMEPGSFFKIEAKRTIQEVYEALHLGKTPPTIQARRPA